MTFKKNILFSFFLLLIYNTALSQEKTEKKLVRLFNQKKTKELADFTKKQLQNFTINSSGDSLMYSKLLHYKYQSEKRTKNYSCLKKSKK